MKNSLREHISKQQFVNELDNFFIDCEPINALSDGELAEARRTINRNMEMLSEEMKTLESRSIEEASNWIIR